MSAIRRVGKMPRGENHDQAGGRGCAVRTVPDEDPEELEEPLLPVIPDPQPGPQEQKPVL